MRATQPPIQPYVLTASRLGSSMVPSSVLLYARRCGNAATGSGPSSAQHFSGGLSPSLASLSVPLPEWVRFANGEMVLAAQRFGGSGDGVLFLHGLAGQSGEWAMVARGVPGAELVGLDLRGHGRSERRPAELSPQAFCSDAVATIKALGHKRVHLVGQSFGGHIAFLVAAWHPELVSSLVVIEADPNGPSPQTDQALASWLQSWPLPFADRGAAEAFFGSDDSGMAWAAGLEEREDGLWPCFDTDVVLRALHGLTARSWWDEWARVRCPTWVVRGNAGDLSEDLAQAMAASVPEASVVSVMGAGHNVHLDRAEAVSRIVRTAVEHSGQ